MSSTMTISLAPEVEAELERLAGERQCGSADLAALAVADYVAREAATVATIRRGMSDMAAGRVVPHDVVMAEVRAIIEAAESARR